jgi:hypothetical protein
MHFDIEPDVVDGRYVGAYVAIGAKKCDLDAAEAYNKLAEMQQDSAERNAERYVKLRRWMTSNVVEGWREVENLSSVGCYVGWDNFDSYLDCLPVCNVGLCEGVA